MSRLFLYCFLVIGFVVATVSCVTQKKRGETSKFGKFYHNTTALYNGYWNAREIMKESMKTLRAANSDDYNKILEVEDYVSVDNPKMVKAEMDKIIEKVSTVSALHEPSDWIDDCYVMMAKAQYMKQEYETAEETLEYFQEDFNPSNPYGRNYKSRKPTGKAAKKAREEEKKEKEKEREAKKKELKEQKEEASRTREEERKNVAKSKADEKKERAKQREKERKEKEKLRKENAKNRKQGKTVAKQDAEPKQTATPTRETEKKSTTTPQPPKTEKKSTKEEEEFKPVKPIKPQVDETAYSEGLLWLAKTYIKRQNWYSAEMLLDKLESGAVSDDIKGELPATYASLYIKQEKYPDALAKLDQAIETEDSGNLKGRYAFIAGQISEITGANDRALAYYQKAGKYTKNLRMEFMSELAEAKSGLSSGSKSREEVLSDLKKMLGEDKNLEYKDQIYFTIAEIENKQKNYAEAVANFRNSINANISNQKLKTESYYQIAEIYYGEEKFLEAANYYDTTRNLLQKADERFGKVSRYVENLKDIATNLEIIKYNDTLLYFASLSPEDQKKVIPGWLKRNKRDIPEEKETAPKDGKLINPSMTVDFGNSNFFAYNKTAKMKGKDEFEKSWGKRPLEDNWRRQNKATGTKEEVTEVTKTDQPDTAKDEISKEDYEKFLRELPNNPMKKQETNDKIMNAMFTLGKLFRDKITNPGKSASTLENMHTRFGPTPNELDSYFYLYLDHTDLENLTKAEEYRQKLIRKYPDSKYSVILSDPDFFNKPKSESNRAEKYYKATYALFEKKEYQKALDAIDQSGKAIEEDDSYNARFLLLRAMCLGGRDGKEAYAKALNEVIAAYPGSPEQAKAKEILRFLGGDASAFTEVRDVDKIYQRDQTMVHYVAVITYNLEETKHINFKVAISEYNKKNFKKENLQLGDGTLNLDENAQIILVRKFENEEKAMEYYRKVMSDAAEFTGNETYSYDVFPISQANYRKMISERNAASYRVFFETKMLGSK